MKKCQDDLDAANAALDAKLPKQEETKTEADQIADAVVEKVKDNTSSDSTASSDPTVTIDYESNTIYVEQ